MQTTTQSAAGTSTQQATAPLNNALTPASLLQYVPEHLQEHNSYYARTDFQVDIEVNGLALGLCDMRDTRFTPRIVVGNEWLTVAHAREAARAILAIADAHDAALQKGGAA